MSMSALRRLAVFAVAAAIVFAGSTALGAAIGPAPEPAPAPHNEHAGTVPSNSRIDSSTTVVTHGAHR